MDWCTCKGPVDTLINNKIMSMEYLYRFGLLAMKLYSNKEIHCCKYNNISCVLYMAAHVTMISLNFANCVTLLTNLNWHIISVGFTLCHVGLFANCFLTKFLVVHLCLVIYTVCCAYSIKFQCLCKLCFSNVIAS